MGFCFFCACLPPSPIQSISSQDMVDLLLAAVCIVNADSRIVFVSPSFERIFGYTPQEAADLAAFLKAL